MLGKQGLSSDPVPGILQGHISEQDKWFQGVYNLLVEVAN